MPGLYTHTTRATGTILTATIYNGDHQNHIDNQTPQMTDDYSANVAQMQATTNPGGVGSESLATALSGEIERLRYAIQQLHNGAQWYAASRVWDLLATTTVSAAATQDYETASWFDGTYEELEFVITDLRVGTDDDTAWIRVKAGGSYQADAGDYRTDVLYRDGISASVAYSNGLNTRGVFAVNIDNSTTENNIGVIRLLTRGNQALKHRLRADFTWVAQDTGIDRRETDIRYQTAEVITGIRFGVDGTNFSARIRVYGKRAA